ncbi:MAG: hypothetical protein EOM14_14925, partial [Clostridia bacterium]|nr:hypothetical protein [Clostridia bacterium]
MDPKVRCPQVSAQLMYRDENNCTLILKGMIYTSNVRGEDSSRAYIISQPGDIMRLETVFGECDVLESHCSWHYLSDGAYAVFSSRILKELFL